MLSRLMSEISNTGAKRMRWFAIAVIFLAAGMAWGQATEATTEATTEPGGKVGSHEKEKTEDKISITHHLLMLNGNKIDYQALAGTILMKDEAGKSKANFFFVAYLKEPAGKPEDRPITFVFNGGPGAAAVWLHLGAVGPKRIELGAEGIPGAPPHRLIDNDQSWLDLSDLVFIDPVGTGFSRAAEGQNPAAFYGVRQDLDSVGDFIRLFLTRYQRWGSPKFLAGESYGTTRAAGLSALLLDRYGIDLNGIILISAVLNFQTISLAEGNDLPYALYLPSYTSIALYHHKLQTADEHTLLDEVQDYALHDYLTALAQGGSLSKEARADVVAHLARYTGLKADYIDRSNLRIDPTRFRKELLSDERQVIGRYDGRITGLDPHPVSGGPDYDPSFSLYLPIYSATFNDYVRRELKFESDLDYEVLSGKVGPWDFGHDADMGYLDVSGELQSAMVQNPHLKVLVNSGYDDLATPFLATKYTFAHLDLLDRLQANVTQAFYLSGHMIYHNPDSLKELKQNVATFMTAAVKQGG
jgi:carboxypeptidase C (cathepsin A)